MTRIIRHAFLTPSHNCWQLWSAAGNQSMTNEGSTHRVFETLVYAVDKLAEDGWRVANIYVDAGAPTLVMLTREMDAAAPDGA